MGKGIAAFLPPQNHGEKEMILLKSCPKEALLEPHVGNNRAWGRNPLAKWAGYTRGFSFVEIIVYICIFVIFLALIIGSFFWYRQAQIGTQRLDVLHGLRQGIYRISDELAYGTGILYPPETDINGPFKHQLAFKNSSNEVLVVFLEADGRLMMANLSKKAENKKYIHKLAEHVIAFKVKRPGFWYVEFEISGKDLQTKMGPEAPEYNFLESVRIRNVVK